MFRPMKTYTSRDGNVAVQAVVGIVAVIGVVVGIAAMKSSSTVGQSYSELKTRLDSMDSSLASVATLEQDLRQVKNSTALLGQEVQGIKEQLAKKVEPPPPPPKGGPGGVGGTKKDDTTSGGPGAPGSGAVHTIKAGDTLGKIAKANKTTIDAIEKLNPGLNEKRLKIGAKIKVR